MSKRPDAAAVVEVALALPVIVGSVGVLSLLGRVVWPEQMWVVPVVWAVGGLALLIPLVENGLGWVIFNMRRPSPGELTKLQPLWEAVCRKAGVDSNKYELWVGQSAGSNAFAAGGRIVAVTRSGLRRPPEVLEAILAHELGHHLSGHPRISLLRWWYELPAWLSFQLVKVLAVALLALLRAVIRVRQGVHLLILTVLALGLLIGLALLNPWLVAGPALSPVMAWLRRRAEYRADRIAADLGAGDTWIRELRRRQFARGGDTRPWLARVFASHPARIDRVRRLLQHARHR